jgi:hypothetical protein
MDMLSIEHGASNAALSVNTNRLSRIMAWTQLNMSSGKCNKAIITTM